MTENQILAEMLYLSESVRNLKEAKKTTVETESRISKDLPTFKNRIRLIVNDLDTEINIRKSMIKSRFIKNPGYDKNKHIVIDYISLADIESGYVNCTLYSDEETLGSEHFYLNLKTGEIDAQTELLEDK